MQLRRGYVAALPLFFLCVETEPTTRGAFVTQQEAEEIKRSPHKHGKNTPTARQNAASWEANLLLGDGAAPQVELQRK